MITLTLEDEIPDYARRLWKAAEANGWQVWATQATGTPIDSDGEPEHLTERRPLFDPNTGAPMMTEGSPATATKKATKPRQRVEVVILPELKVITSVVLRFRRGSARCYGSWEGSSFRAGQQLGRLGLINFNELSAIIKEAP